MELYKLVLKKETWPNGIYWLPFNSVYDYYSLVKSTFRRKHPFNWCLRQLVLHPCVDWRLLRKSLGHVKKLEGGWFTVLFFYMEPKLVSSSIYFFFGFFCLTPGSAQELCIMYYLVTTVFKLKGKKNVKKFGSLQVMSDQWLKTGNHTIFCLRVQK